MTPRVFALLLVGSSLLSECEDPPANPSPMTPIPGLAGPLTKPRAVAGALDPGRPPSSPLPTQPSPPVGPEPKAPSAAEPVAVVPTPKQLAGAFDLRVRSSSADGVNAEDLRIAGDAQGAALTLLVTGKGERFDSYRVDAPSVARLLKSLDAEKWWSLADAPAEGGEANRSTLEFGRADFRHNFGVANGSSTPQGGVLKLLTYFAASLGPKARDKFSPTAIETFKPPRLTGPVEKLECEPAPSGQFSCGGTRCFSAGKLLACFRSPFKSDKGSPVKAPKVSPGKAAAAKSPPGYFWALELKDGRQCVGPPLPVPAPRWQCKGSKDTEDVERLIHSGEALLVLIGSPARAVPVVKAWK